LYVPTLGIRISDSSLARWQALARERGLSVAGMIRLAVEDLEKTRSGRGLADLVATEVVSRLEERFEKLEEGAVGGPIQERPFERGCLDADIHRPGTRCPGCGGSFNP